jgi:hypothetical protein
VFLPYINQVHHSIYALWRERGTHGREKEKERRKKNKKEENKI